MPGVSPALLFALHQVLHHLRSLSIEVVALGDDLVRIEELARGVVVGVAALPPEPLGFLVVVPTGRVGEGSDGCT